MAITIKRTLVLDHTADDWGLFTSKDFAARSAQATNILNKTVEDALNSGMNPVDAWKSIEEVMERLSHVGAADTEAEAALDVIFNVWLKMQDTR